MIIGQSQSQSHSPPSAKVRQAGGGRQRSLCAGLVRRCWRVRCSRRLPQELRCTGQGAIACARRLPRINSAALSPALCHRIPWTAPDPLDRGARSSALRPGLVERAVDHATLSRGLRGHRDDQPVWRFDYRRRPVHQSRRACTVRLSLRGHRRGLHAGILIELIGESPQEGREIDEPLEPEHIDRSQRCESVTLSLCRRLRRSPGCAVWTRAP